MSKFQKEKKSQGQEGENLNFCPDGGMGFKMLSLNALGGGGGGGGCLCKINF